MCIWKAWKTPKTKVANLVKCGIGKYKACEWGNTRKGYWRIADSPILKVAINKDSLRKAVSILRNTHCMPYGLIVILPPHNNQTE